jgi:HD-GYP domain-containing protein (c-di-GMP phosphodiesterase class II)
MLPTCDTSLRPFQWFLMSSSVAPAAHPADTAEQVSVGIDELIAGRPLQFPVHDDQGVLLLAAGQLITDEFKQKLRAHRVGSVKLNTADAARCTLRDVRPSTAPLSVSIDTELAKKIDAVIDGGLMQVSNKGPAVKSNIVYLGRKAYDKNQRKELLSQHDKNSTALGQLMTEALHGNCLDGTCVSMMAAEYLKQMTTDVDNTLTSTADLMKDESIIARSVEVSLLSMALGVELGLDAGNIRDLGMVGLVHDWGMMKVPAAIRSLPRRLTPLEQVEVKKHPIYSLEMLQRVSSLPSIVPVVAYQVHERVNGKGYPRGRRGLSIHIFARILQVADTYVALTTAKPYRPALMPYAAMECMVRQAREKMICPDAMKAMLKVMGLFPLNSVVQLTDGSVARVLRRNQDHYTQPIVQRLQTAAGEPVDPNDLDQILDLKDNPVQVRQALPTPGKKEVSLTVEQQTWQC